jgi:hypothetical protein
MSLKRIDFTPVIIVGAGRSGTNILRDAITGLPGFGTWPCDEINPIWRHGNIAWPSDEIPAENAIKSRAYIRRACERIWRETGTCANSMRVPFVDAVVPEAKYIHIVRDGVDVVASAQKRWRGEMELASLPYYLAKIKYTPLQDLPIYGWSFVKNRLAMLRNEQKRMDIWGPRFADMDAMREQGASLDALCAMQWAQCVNAADAALAPMPEDKALTLHYEAFTADPTTVLTQVLNFLEADCDTSEIADAASGVSSQSVGKGRKSLSGDVERIMEIMRPTLMQHRYEG